MVMVLMGDGDSANVIEMVIRMVMMDPKVAYGMLASLAPIHLL